MKPFSSLTSQTQPEDFTGQIRERQRAIHQNSRKLEEVRQRRLRVEEEIIQCTRETEQRVEVMMGQSGIVDALQQLGHMLQEERHLSEQLNGLASEDRNLKSDLRERSERFTNKARSLTAEILEVKQHLAEAKARTMAAEADALLHAPTRKTRRNQRKPK